MNNISRIISFIIGLIIIFLIFSLISSKMKKGNAENPPLAQNVVTEQKKAGWFDWIFGKKPTPTPPPIITGDDIFNTPTGIPLNGNNVEAVKTTTPIPSNNGNTNNNTNNTSSSIKKTPDSGAETALIPIAMSMLGTGIYLRRKK